MKIETDPEYKTPGSTAATFECFCFHVMTIAGI